jgi:hypothetical protein
VAVATRPALPQIREARPAHNACAGKRASLGGSVREVDLDDPDNYMGSKNLLEQAERLGCAWDDVMVT